MTHPRPTVTALRRAAVWLRAARLAEQDGRPDQRRQWLQRVAASDAPQAASARRQLQAP